MFGMGGGNRVHVRVTGDDASLDQTLDKSEKGLRSFGDRTAGSLKNTASQIKSQFALAAGAAIVGLVTTATRAASDLEESNNSIQKVFGDSADTLDDFGKVAANVAGLSQREFNQLATVTGSLLQNVGFSAEEAANKTIQLTTRAADMASVFNTDVGTALEAINSALKGEQDPIEQFGVKVNAAAVEAKALEMGLAATKGELDDNAKATAALELIMEQTANTAGDFAQTTDSLANSQRVAAARAENAAAKFGKAWTPIFAEITNFAADTLLSIQALSGDETAKMELRISEAMEGIRQAAAGTGDPMTALADGLLHVAREGELTHGVFQTLAAQAGLAPEQFDSFRDAVLEQADALGIDEDMMRELETAMTETEDPARALEDATDDLAAAEEEQAEKTEEAKKALEEKEEALRNVHDPLFRIVRENEKLAEAEQAVLEAEKEYGRESKEYRDAVMDRAEIIGGLQDTLQELKEQGIDPTGVAAREMLKDMGVPDDVISEIFRQFDEIERNLESRDFNISPSVANRPRGGGPFHTGGRVNAPKGEEVQVTVLGGEEISNPDHDNGSQPAVRGVGKVEHHWHITQPMDPREVFDYAAWKLRSTGI